MIDIDLLEAIHSRITTSENESEEISSLCHDLEYIAVMPKSHYQGFTTSNCLLKLREYLEAYLEQGYSIEEILEGIKINLCKLDDKFQMLQLVEEIKTYNEEITYLRNKKLELEEELLSLVNESIKENIVEYWIKEHMANNEGNEKEVREYCLKEIKEELAKLKNEEDLDLIDITSYNFIYLLHEGERFNLEPEAIILKVEHDLADFETV